LIEPPASKYTGTFLELLSKASKSLIVSTYQAGKLVLLRAQDEHINTHFVDVNKPMGVAFQNGRLSVGANNRIIDYFNSTSAANKLTTDLHDAAYLPRKIHVTGDIDIHEMAFDDDAELWIINTRMSCLCTLDNRHSFVPRWRPPFISAYDVTDRCHLNGLAMRDGRPKYVTALGTSDKPAGWRDTKATGGVVMDIDSNAIICEGLSMPHSPRWYRNKLWILESGAGQLINIDENSGEKTVIAQLPGFCRGIDFIEHYAVIGLSEVRETAVFSGLPLTAREQNRKCGVWIVDITTGNTAGYLEFTSGIQEIFSVQFLPNKYPTLLEFNDRLLDSTYSVPEHLIGEFSGPAPQQKQLEQARSHFHHKNFEQALSLYRSILDEDPSSASIQFCVAETLANMNQWNEALVYLKKVISLQENHAQAHELLGHFHRLKYDIDTAIECYDKAIAVDQQFASAHYHRACMKLSQGDFQNGWSGFEWRTQMPDFKRVNLPHPKWHGEDINSKTLLLITEDNDADTIFFARYLALAKQRCDKLIVVCSEPLRPFLQAVVGVDEVRRHGELPIDLFDVYASLSSLGALLKVDNTTQAIQTPYLSIDRQIVVPDLKARDPDAKIALRIGLIWSSSSTQATHRHRSCPLTEMMKVVANSRCESTAFYSFQTQLFSQDKEILKRNNVIDLEQELVGFIQTGALMQQMDLIISVDHASAHLAGALGLPTILLLSNDVDWCWINDSQIGSWYPSIETLRQHGTNEWNESIHRCTSLIENRYRNHQ